MGPLLDGHPALADELVDGLCDFIDVLVPRDVCKHVVHVGLVNQRSAYIILKVWCCFCNKCCHIAVFPNDGKNRGCSVSKSHFCWDYFNQCRILSHSKSFLGDQHSSEASVLLGKIEGVEKFRYVSN